MKMKLRSLGLIAVLFFAIPLFADDDPQTPYPVEERCVDAPTLAPDDFSYSGRLLMTGYAGIHAMRADWETPRIEAFFNENELGVPIDGGQLSPDGKWYAAPVGFISLETFSMNKYWYPVGVRVYSMVNDDEMLVNFADYGRILDAAYIPGATTIEPVKWIDNEELIAGEYKIHLFDKKVIQSPIIIYQPFGGSFEIAPDWSRVFGWLPFPQTEDSDLAPLITVNVNAYVVAWTHDPKQLMAQTGDPNSSLSLFDRDGTFIETVYVPQKDRYFDIKRTVVARNELGWSPNDRYFVIVEKAYPIPPDLILLDTKDKVAINTCLEAVSQPVWSPDGTQLAFLMRGRTNLNIVILDLESWKASIVGQHSGSGWGVLQPDMLAWIDDE